MYVWNTSLRFGKCIKVRLIKQFSNIRLSYHVIFAFIKEIRRWLKVFSSSSDYRRKVMRVCGSAMQVALNQFVRYLSVCADFCNFDLLIGKIYRKDINCILMSKTIREKAIRCKHTENLCEHPNLNCQFLCYEIRLSSCWPIWSFRL